MAGSAASWESWKPSWGDIGSTAAHGAWGDNDSDVDDSESLDDITPDAAGQELVSVLIDLKNAGRLSAVQACAISWFAAKAGAVAPLCRSWSQARTGAHRSIQQ